MGVRDKWMCPKESSVIINSLLLISLCATVATLPVKSCVEGQKLRTDENGQDFKFCSKDQGYDFCTDCSQDRYSNDRPDTANWDKEVVVCVTKPECKAEEVVLVGNACQCNLGNGYWGRDPKNCQYDRKNCVDAGRQLDFKGNCIDCPDDKFKSESGVHGLCRDKTRCREDEEEIDSGSKERDRQCQKIRVLTAIVPTTTTESTWGNTTIPFLPKEEESSSITWVVGVIVVCFVVGLVLLFIACRKGYIRMCFGCIRQQIYSVLKPSETVPNERGKLMTGMRGGIPVENDETRQGTEVDEDEISIPGAVPFEDPVPAQNEEPVCTGFISTEEQEPVTRTQENKPPSLCLSSINESNQTSSLGQSFDVFQTPEGLHRRSLIDLQPPIFSVHEGEQDLATNPKCPVSDFEYETANSEPYGNFPQSESCGEVPHNLPHSESDGNLPHTLPTIQQEDPIIACDGATANASPRMNQVVKEDEDKPVKKPVATVLPIPQNQSDVTAENQGDGFPASPTTAGGNEIGSPTPEHQVSYKLNPNAPYGEYIPAAVNLEPPPEDVSRNIDIESQASNNTGVLQGEEMQRNSAATSAGNNEERVQEDVRVTGGLSNICEIDSTESQAVRQGSNICTTASGNPLAAPESDEVRPNEPFLPDQVGTENEQVDSENEQEGERQRLFQC